MARSSLARAIFFGTKPYHSHLILPRPIPPVRNFPRPSVGIPYSTKPTNEALQPHGSSSSSSNVASSSSDTSVSQTPSSLLNPPPSARPPPFNLPVRQPNQKLKYYYALGKASLLFYKTGIKAIYTNYKLMRSIRARLSDDALRMPQTELLKQGLIARGEYHLIRRTLADLARAPLFALIFLVFSEWTPLVVVAFSGAVPRTLWIPKQVQKAREKMQQRRNEAKATSQDVIPTEVNGPQFGPAQRDALVSVGRMLGVYPAWWDGLPWMPARLVIGRVQRRLQELEADDMAIERDGGVGELEETEVGMAAEARGLDVLDKDVEELRRDLKRWLQARKRTSATELIIRGLPPLSKNS